MITVAKEITISGGTAPYVYNITTDMPCVTITPASGSTASGKINITLSYADTDCIADSTITAVAVDAKGCRSSSTLTVDSPCDNFVLDDISESADLTFSINAGATGCSSVSFTWTYDTSIFSQVTRSDSSFTSTLKLMYKSGVQNFPTSTTIKVQATDCNSCTLESTKLHNICIPTAGNFVTDLLCFSSGTNPTYASGIVTIPDPTGCSGTLFDWSTLSVELPSNFTVETYKTRADLDENQIVFKATNLGTITSGLYTAKFNVKSTMGIPSSKGNFLLRVNKCQPGKTIIIPNKTINLDCDLIAGDTQDIDINNEIQVASGATISWSTWQVIQPPVTKSSSITLVTLSNGHRAIRYTLPDPVADDAFGWTVCDTDGNCADVAVYTIVDCPDSPVANDDMASVACLGSVVINVLLNDASTASPLDINTIQLVTYPSYGTYFVPGDGTIIYTANAGYNGFDEFTYTVKNVSGATSNEATVGITVVCGGTDALVSLCN